MLESRAAYRRSQVSTDNIAVIRAFCADFSHLDTDRMMAYFTDSPTYHNMPGPPAVGTEAVRATIQRFLSGWQKTEWDLLNIAANGDVVFAERLDRPTRTASTLTCPASVCSRWRTGKSGRGGTTSTLPRTRARWRRRRPGALERAKGIEPSSQPWEGRILPLNHTRPGARRSSYHPLSLRSRRSSCPSPPNWHSLPSNSMN